MDRIVSVSKEFLNRIRAFLNIYAQQCKGCMRRADMDCVGCNARIANVLMLQLDSAKDAKEEQYYIENPRYERYMRICKAIEQAGRPLRANEIALDDVGYNLKKFTLRSMCKKKILKMSKNECDKNVYEILNGMKSIK